MQYVSCFVFVLDTSETSGIYPNKLFISGYNSSGVTWSEAQLLCESFGSQLISINDNETLVNAYNMLIELESLSLSIDETAWLFAWIGLKLDENIDSHNNTNNWEWSWIDGAQSNFSRWYNDDQSSWTCNNNYNDNTTSIQTIRKKCGHFVGKNALRPSLDVPIWDAGDCNSVSKQYICNSIHNNTVIIDGAANETSICSFGGYRAVYSPVVEYTWGQAHRYCVEHFGTSLGTIHSSQENVDTRIALGTCLPNNHSVNDYWIGYTDAVTEGLFEWADTTERSWPFATYSNWDDGK